MGDAALGREVCDSDPAAHFVCLSQVTWKHAEDPVDALHRVANCVDIGERSRYELDPGVAKLDRFGRRRIAHDCANGPIRPR